MGLTPGALTFAIFCVLWTGATAFVAGAVGSLYLQTRRRLDFISLLSYVVVIAMLASVGQQVYTIARWDKLKAQEHQDSIDMAGKAQMFEIGSNKIVQAFYYTQLLCYNIGAGLIAFWCGFLWGNVWQIRSYCWKGSTFMTIVKWSTIVASCALMGTSRINYFSDKPVARFLVGNILLMMFLTATPIFLFLILYRYLHFRMITISSIRRQRSKMQRVHSLPKEPLYGVTTEGSTGASDHIIELESFPIEREQPPTPTPQKRTTFGTLLMLRFVGAIVVMSGLGIFHVCFQITKVMSFDHTQDIKEIPLTTTAQMNDTYLFLPATVQGWLILLVFGTTEGYWGRFKSLLSWIFCFGCLHGSLFPEHMEGKHDTRQGQLEGQPPDLDHYMSTLRKRDIEHSPKELEEEEIEDDRDSAIQGVRKHPDSTLERSDPYILGHVNGTQPPPLDMNRTSTLFESLSKPLPRLPPSLKAGYSSESVHEPTLELRSVS